MGNYKNYILSCIDGSKFSESVFDYSVWMASNTGAPLKLLHTINHDSDPVFANLSGSLGLGESEELLEDYTLQEQKKRALQIKQGNKILQLFKDKALDMGLKEVEKTQYHGSLVSTLIEQEDDIRAVVLGIRGEEHESDSKELGSQLEPAIRSLHRPILVVNSEFSTPKTIMLAFNGSKESNMALNTIVESTLLKGLPCHLVHVQDRQNISASVLESAKAKLEASGHEVVTASLSGEIDSALASYQVEHDIDLMVMGAFSHNRIRDFLLGSLTAKVLGKTRKPLLLLR